MASIPSTTQSLLPREQTFQNLTKWVDSYKATIESTAQDLKAKIENYPLETLLLASLLTAASLTGLWTFEWIFSFSFIQLVCTIIEVSIKAIWALSVLLVGQRLLNGPAQQDLTPNNPAPSGVSSASSSSENVPAQSNDLPLNNSAPSEVISASSDSSSGDDIVEGKEEEDI